MKQKKKDAKKMVLKKITITKLNNLNLHNIKGGQIEANKGNPPTVGSICPTIIAKS